MTDTVVGVLAIVGATLVFLAGVGVMRFTDLYARMHAATKATTVGIGLIAIAGAIAVPGGTAKIVTAAIFIFVTAPSGAHFIGREAYHAEHIEISLDGPDDLSAMLDEPDQPR
ncbi:MAG: monovalent cation/H(+) antiporter subunit G [Acidimicrobiia bacterium]